VTRPDPLWLAQLIGEAVRRHESWEDCTCDEDNGCWYHLSKHEQDIERGRHVLFALDMEDLIVVPDPDADQ